MKSPFQIIRSRLAWGAVVSSAALLQVSDVSAQAEGEGAAESSATPLVPAEALSAVEAAGAKPAGVVSPSGTALPLSPNSRLRPGALDFPGKTILDDPATSHPVFGVPSVEDIDPAIPRLSKIDLDGDLNYNGAIDNDDSTNQGTLEDVPPGLQIGVGELSKLVIRFKTYQFDYPGELLVTLELAAINRDSASGSYADSASGEASSGKIRVWRDLGRTELLLESGDPDKSSFVWKVDPEKLRLGLPAGVPRVLYVEGVKSSPKFEGDLRLLLWAGHVGELGGPAPRPPSQVSALYRTAFDHILVTVRDEPIEKEFINNNAEGVWSMVGDAVSEVETEEAASEAEGSAPKAESDR